MLRIMHTGHTCVKNEQRDKREKVKEPIRFLGGIFHCPQTRWSKEAYAMYMRQLDDLIDNILFTTRTDHRNLLFMNNHGQ